MKYFLLLLFLLLASQVKAAPYPVVCASDGTHALTFPSGGNEFKCTTLSGSSGGLTVGTTTIASGTNTYIEYNNNGVLGEYSLDGTGTAVVMETGPTFAGTVTMPDSSTWTSSGIGSLAALGIGETVPSSGNINISGVYEIAGTQIACANLSNATSACSTAIGTSGATIPLLSTANTWSTTQTISTSNLNGINITGITTAVGVNTTATTTGAGLQYNTTNATSTTASALRIAGTATITADYSGAFINENPVRTMTAVATRAESGNMLAVTPSYTITGSSASIMNVSGPMVNLSRTVSNTSSSGSSSIGLSGAVLAVANPSPTRTNPVSDTAPVVTITQSDASGSGIVLDVKNSSGAVTAAFEKAPVVIGSSSAQAGAALDMSATVNSMLLPTGTTGQRPTGIAGMLRYNSDSTGSLEAYYNSVWNTLGAGSSGTVTSIATTSPITGGTITTTGTIACATCTTASSLTNLGIVYGGGAVALSATSTLANAALITSSTGVPSESQTLPTAVQQNITALGAVTTGSLSLSGTTTLGTLVTTSTATLASLTLGNVMSGTQCLHASAAGIVTGTGSDCGAGGGGVSSVSGDGTYITNSGSTGAVTLTDTFGTAAQKNTGTSGGNVPLLNGANAFTNMASITYGSSLTAGSVLDMSSVTSSMILPTGTTGQEPSGVAGMLRYNSANPNVEAYYNSVWLPLAATTTTNAIDQNIAYTDVKNVYSASQRATLQTVSISTATYTPNFDTGADFSITLVHASCPCTLANPSTTPVAGQHGIIYIIQSATGSDTITTWGSDYLISGATANITLSSGANNIDVFSYTVLSSTQIVLSGPATNVAH